MITALDYNAILRPDGIIIYPSILNGSYSFNESGGRYDVSQESQEHNGEISRNAKRKIKYAVNMMLASSCKKCIHNRKKRRNFYFKVAFVTLTLSSGQKGVTDNEIKTKMLNQLLVELRRYFGVESYIWKCERQVNGNLHIHLTIDKIVPWYALRNIWNRIQAKYHFISDYREKFGKCNPNSVDIHSVKKIKDLAGYLIKYITKEAGKPCGNCDNCADGKICDNKTVQGRIWGCSKNLAYSNKLSLSLGAFPELDKALTMMQRFGRCFDSDFFMFIDCPHWEWRQWMPLEIMHKWQMHVDSVRGRPPDKLTPVDIYGVEFKDFQYSELPDGTRIKCVH